MRSGETRGGMRVPAHNPAHTVAGGEEVTVAGIRFDVLDVPGHSAGHVAFLAEGELFSGDLLFAGSVGRVDLPGGDWELLLASVRTLLDRLPAETVVHPGHGPATTLGRELQTNPFLRELRAERST
jgi:glyoxylase-like metal-dependent hydrolase (beta-lactamase superfamily II)